MNASNDTQRKSTHGSATHTNEDIQENGSLGSAPDGNKDAQIKSSSGTLQSLQNDEPEVSSRTLEQSSSASSSKPSRPTSAAPRPLPEIAGRPGSAAPTARPGIVAPMAQQDADDQIRRLSNDDRSRRWSHGGVPQPGNAVVTPRQLVPLQDAAEDRICRAVVSALKAEIDIQAHRLFLETRQVASELQGDMMREMKELIQQLRVEVHHLGSEKATSSSDVHGNAVKSLDSACQQITQQGTVQVRQPEASGSDPAFMNSIPQTGRKGSRPLDGNVPEGPHPARSLITSRSEAQSNCRETLYPPPDHHSFAADPGLLGPDESSEWGLVQVGSDGEPIIDRHGQVQVLLPGGQVTTVNSQRCAFPVSGNETAPAVQDASADAGLMVPIERGGYVISDIPSEDYIRARPPAGYTMVTGVGQHGEGYNAISADGGRFEIVPASMLYSNEGEIVLMQPGQSQEMYALANSSMYRHSPSVSQRPIMTRRRPDIVRAHGRRQNPRVPTS